MLRRFARAVLNGYVDGEVGDIDGFTLEDLGERLGLLVVMDNGGLCLCDSLKRIPDDVVSNDLDIQ